MQVIVIKKQPELEQKLFLIFALIKSFLLGIIAKIWENEFNFGSLNKERRILPMILHERS